MRNRSTFEEVLLLAYRLGPINAKTVRRAAWEVRSRRNEEHDQVRDQGWDPAAEDHESSGVSV